MGEDNRRGGNIAQYFNNIETTVLKTRIYYLCKIKIWRQLLIIYFSILIRHFRIFNFFFTVSEVYFIDFSTTHLSNISAFVQHDDK